MLLAVAGVGLWLALSAGEAPDAEPPGPARSTIRQVEAPPPATRLARAERRTGAAKPRSRVPEERTASGSAASRVVVPAIGVDASMIDLGLNADDSLEVPADSDQTGWWTGGAFPGEPGTAVIAGHVDSVSGPAVFYRLDELAPGDEIRVAGRSGEVTRFVVERSKSVAKDSFPTREVYAPTAGPSLRLITCGGEFAEQTGHYEDNLIVFARRA